MQEHLSNFRPEGMHTRDELVYATLRSIGGIRRGTQSHVSFIDLPGVPADIPVLLKRMGVDKALTYDEASSLQARLEPYRESLVVAGWNVPHIYGSHLAEVGDEWQIWSYEQYIPGINPEVLLRAGGAKTLAWYAMRDVINTLTDYRPDMLRQKQVNHTELTLLPHGIDLQPANKVIAENGVRYLVDIFGPKELDSGGNLVSYSAKLETVPAEVLTVVCATRQGALLRYMRKTQEIWAYGDQRLINEFIEDVDELLACSDMPESEAKMIINEMDGGYPFLNAIYSGQIKL